MPPKRARRASPGPSGLSAGERLKRTKLTTNAAYSAWGWVGTEVTTASQVQHAHRSATCGFYGHNAPCLNKYSKKASQPREEDDVQTSPSPDKCLDDIIVISDDDGLACSTKSCKNNPYCLNYLGQEEWEDAEEAYETYLKSHYIGGDPADDLREGQTPIGLKNLGATCYANAYLQVWFQDIPFRKGVYACQPAPEALQPFEVSPIFQLQVTFAAMQHSKLSAFNPVKLVESLKLRASEQQDAQEFSKLFMAHLDNEFKKQSIPELQSLISDQFQGKQMYNTVCQRCHRRSERDSDFLEIEVNLENNATLEERLTVLLEPETLSGDNKYFCQRCGGLQDAKRYTELRELPPVLHFSLLRFVYDITTMERKKSKQTIMFPTCIDMDRFVGSEESRKRHKKHKRESQNLYELRGILLHKGTSAYHGHYEAQVFDVHNQGWYQFNDETVTKIESLVPKPDTGKKVAGKPTGKDGVQKKAVPRGRPPKKRQRIDSDSDHEIEVMEAMPSQNGEGAETPEGPQYISSRDAYMLVYARVGYKGSPSPPQQVNGHGSSTTSPRLSTSIPEGTPPPKALEVINSLNAVHTRACKEYAWREKEAKERFDKIRQSVMDIYRTWNLSSREEEGVVVSRQALETWLSRHITKPKKSDKKISLAPDATSNKAETSTSDTTMKNDDKSDAKEEGPSFIPISNSDIICPHGKLDPDKANEMKVIRATACDRIADEDGCRLSPRLSTDDVCVTCVERIFKEKLYQVEHPRLVSRFEEVALVEDNEDGFYISKAWLKDWRLAKPKMHVEGAPDPPPDAEQYVRDVICEHGELGTNVGSRRRISAKAYTILHEVFPNWSPPSLITETCPICEALLHVTQEDRRETRKQAEEEKARLKHMYDNALNGNTALLEQVPCAIVPSQFVRSWRQWLFRPGEVSRPETVDNSQFMCEHGLLAIDPNVSGDLDASVTIIKRSDWDVLDELYSAGPLIAVENADGRYLHELDVCADCRLKRRTSFDMTEITIRVLGPGDPTPNPQTYTEDLPPPSKPTAPVQTTLSFTYSKREGSRKSKRLLQQGREHGRRRKITITKAMTLKDLKIMLNDELAVPVIAQRIFYHGHELDDSSATMLSLGIMSNDLLDLKEESDDVVVLDSDDDEPTTVKNGAKKRAEGEAFGGTLLGSYRATQSSAPSAPSSSPSAAPTSLACPACTYENGATDMACAMCETPLSNGM